jgi:hypothetical protein
MEAGIINDNSYNITALQSQFLSMRDGGELPEGL